MTDDNWLPPTEYTLGPFGPKVRAHGGQAVIPCDCGPPMAYDLMTDRYRCERRRCTHRIDAETMHQYLTLLD